MTTDIQKINDEVTKELANKETFNTLLAITFKGLEPENVKLAIVEGMIRGFTFKDFLEKNVYAIAFKNHSTGKQEYSLITSIDYLRKRGMNSGIVGTSLPIYEEKEGRIISCSISVKRKINAVDIGEFFAKVYFVEYTTGKNQWTSKPRTMIAKVAEAHALRKACPEELSQMYTADEMGDRVVEAKVVEKVEPIDIKKLEEKLASSKSQAELKANWIALPQEAKEKLTKLKDELKDDLKKVLI